LQVFHQVDELLPITTDIPLDDLLACALLLYFGINTLRVSGRSVGGCCCCCLSCCCCCVCAGWMAPLLYFGINTLRVSGCCGWSAGAVAAAVRQHTDIPLDGDSLA
jgi:hypothetical protein